MKPVEGDRVGDSELTPHSCPRLGSQTELFDLDSYHLNPENALLRRVLPLPILQPKKFDLKTGITVP